MNEIEPIPNIVTLTLIGILLASITPLVFSIWVYKQFTPEE